MTLALRYTVRSDVGLLREGNEDSAYAGPHLLAIADGMGGHAAGEVASAVAIATLAPLDADTSGIDMLQALADAIAEAFGLDSDPDPAVPSSLLVPDAKQITVLLDRAAAKRLGPEV